MAVESTSEWWHGAVVYHIYPRSFYDSNNDGVGDLEGIISKLDYLNGKPDSLGVDAIWISPFYPSPMVDYGYDVSDYCGVDPIFGTIEDFDNLVAEAHKRNIKVIVDFVPNHTSDQHKWFKESASANDSPKRDWYIWADAQPDGGPPNNWKSVFGGSAWQYHEATGQYYLHSFLKEQPDLNWNNPKVRSAMKKAMRFWLDKGIDGFRVDAISWLSKDLKMRDDPLNPEYRPGEDDPYHEVIHSFSLKGPYLFDYLNEMISVCTEYKDRFMITEAYPDIRGEISHYLQYYENLDYRHCAPFNFECIFFPWDAHTYRGFIDLFQEALLPGQPPIYNMGNHDNSRLASRIGPEAARTAAMLLLTLPGIPFIYYGEEIGMRDVEIPENRIRDTSALIGGPGRDGERTPMQWGSETNAGFTKGTPWLPVGNNYADCNVSAQQRQQTSLINLYKSLLRIRHAHTAFRHGVYRSIELGNDVFGFVRENNKERYTVVLNFSSNNIDTEKKALKGDIILSTYMDTPEPPGNTDVFSINGRLKLRPHEGVIIVAG